MLLRIIPLLLFFSVAQAQQDSARWLKEVSVAEPRLSMSVRNGISDTLENTSAIKLSAGNLAAQLEREENVFIRNYGNGNLSTVSIRGGSSAQTAVLWNGLQVQSAMLGVYDLSLIPSFLSGITEVRYGGSSPSTGSGAMSGALLMNSNAEQLKGYELSLFSGIGEYGHYQTGIGFSAGTKKFSSSTRVYSQRSDNNFRYLNSEGEDALQTHSAFMQAGVAQDFRVETKAGRFDLHGWYLTNEREIAPHMLTTTSQQEQDDEALRISGSWQKSVKQWNYQLRNGWSLEKINYRDPAARLDEKSKAHIFQPEAQVSYKPSASLSLIMEAGALLTSAVTESYDDTKITEQYTLSSSAVFNQNNWLLQGVIRSGVFNGDALPLLPSILVRKSFTKLPSIRFEASSVYRNPTLNDLYWKPGGNTELQPEQGYHFSAGLDKIFSSESFFIKTEAGIFYTDMHNLLTWIPDAKGIYYAMNLERVQSKGLEGSILVRSCFNKINFRISFHGQYNPAVLKESSVMLAPGINKQLIYTPLVLAKGQAEITWQQFSLRYFHSYTGYRYVTQDHSYYLEPYMLGEVMLSWDKQFKRTGFTVYFNVKNCWDGPYQVIALRAMPGRYFESGILFKLRNF